jgi:hypothetical protein
LTRLTGGVLRTALAIALAGFVLTHLGAYPWIQETSGYLFLLAFVTLNTVGFAMLAAVKIGFQSGRRARGRVHVGPQRGVSPDVSTEAGHSARDEQ